MLQSIIAGSPVLAAAVAILAGVFVLLVVGAAVSNWRDRRRVAAGTEAERVAPAAYPAVNPVPAYQPAFQEYHAEPTPTAAEPVPRRSGFGFAALSIAFLVGVAAGVAAMLTARDEVAAGLAQLAALVGADAPVPAAGAGDGGRAEGTPPHPTAPGPEVMSRLAAFATSLEQTLPRQAGPELSLTRVAVEGTTLNLGYDIGRVVPPDEVDDFQGYIGRTVRSLFCAREAGEVRYLSENGVDFHMSYVDPRGITVTELTVTPEFCA